MLLLLVFETSEIFLPARPYSVPAISKLVPFFNYNFCLTFVATFLLLAGCETAFWYSLLKSTATVYFFVTTSRKIIS